MWPSSVITRSGAFKANGRSSVRFGEERVEEEKAKDKKHREEWKEKVATRDIASVATKVMDSHNVRKRNALRRPYYCEDEEKKKTKGPEMELFWEGSSKSFAKLELESKHLKIALVRKKLLEEGHLPSKPRMVFLAKGQPLNELQESMCGIQLFGDIFPLKVFVRVCGGENHRHDCRPTPRKEDSAVDLVVEELRDLFTKMVRICGRQVLVDLFDRFDLNRSGFLELDDLRKLLKKICTESSLFDTISSKQVEDVLHKLDKDKDGKLSYSEFCQCLPSHIRKSRQRKDEQHKTGMRDSTLEQIKERLSEYDHDGIHDAVHISSLQKVSVKTKLTAPQNQLRSSYPTFNRYPDRSKESSIGESSECDTYFHPEFGCEGYITPFLGLAEQKRTGKVWFHARFDLYAEFYDLDTAGTGVLSYREIQQVLRRFRCGEAHLQVSAVGLREALSRFRVPKGYDYVSFVDFCIPRSEQQRAETLERIISHIRDCFLRKSYGGLELRNIFKTFDPSSTGNISVTNFKECITEVFKVKITKDELKQVLDKFDPKRRNFVSYVEFIAFIERGHERWSDVSRMKTAFIKAIRDDFCGEASGKFEVERAFKYLDFDKNGLVSEDDLICIFKRLSGEVKDNLDEDVKAYSTIIDGRRYTRRPDPIPEWSKEKKPVPAELVRLLKKYPEIHHPTNLHRILQCQAFKWDTSNKNGLDKEAFASFMDVKMSQAEAGNAFRAALLETWQTKKWDFSKLYYLCCCTKEEIKHEKKIHIGAKIPDNYITAQSLMRCARNDLHIQLCKEKAHLIADKLIQQPRGFHEFVDFLFPSSAPSLRDIAARVQSAMKRQSIGGMRMRHCFESFDVSKSGMLTIGNFKQGLLKLGLGLSQSDADRLIDSKIIQSNNRGEISYDEFVRFSLQSSEWNVEKDQQEEDQQPKSTIPQANPKSYSPYETRRQVRSYMSSSRPF